MERSCLDPADPVPQPLGQAGRAGGGASGAGRPRDEKGKGPGMAYRRADQIATFGAGRCPGGYPSVAPRATPDAATVPVTGFMDGGPVGGKD